MALCKLLQHSLNTDDKRLQDIVVKGEEIYSPDDGIRTRSKSAKSKTLNDFELEQRDCWKQNFHHEKMQMFRLNRSRALDQHSFAGEDL